MQALVLTSRHPVAVAFRGVLTVLLIGFLFFPVYWMLATALKPNDQIFVQFPSLIPTRPIIDNFWRAISQSNLSGYLVNSLITAGGSSLITTTLAAWTPGLEVEGVVLAPVSAVINLQQDR